MFSSVKKVHPTVHHLTPRRVAVSAGANPSWFRARARSHSGRVASLSHGHKDILSVASWPSVQAFGLRQQNLQTAPPWCQDRGIELTTFLKSVLFFPGHTSEL